MPQVKSERIEQMRRDLRKRILDKNKKLESIQEKKRKFDVWNAACGDVIPQ